KAPGRLLTYLDRATAREQLGKVDEAIDDLKEALDGGLDLARLYFLRARLHRRKGNEAAARKDVDAGLKMKPTDDLDWVSRGLVRRWKSAREGLADMDEALKLNPSSRAALMSKASILAESLHDQAAAEAVLGRAVRPFPHPPPA